MQNTSQDFGLFIENIRVSRKILQDDFVDGIISKRQYQRYLKGESAISNEKIFKLVDRLEMNFLNIYSLYFSRENTEYTYVSQIYSNIINMKYKDAYNLLSEYNKSDLTSKYNETFFEFCEISTLHYLKRIPTDVAMNKFKILIDYPNCLNFKEVNFVELITLISISNHAYKKSNDKRAIFFLYNILKNKNAAKFGDLNSKIPSLIANVCNSLGQMDENEKVLSLAQTGINICLKNHISNSLVHLFYYKALALLYLGRTEEAKISIKKSFLLLYVEDNREKSEIFEVNLKKHFGLNISDLEKV